MATFPALQPSTRTFTPGRYPHSEIPTLSGLQTRVRTSNVLLDQRLRLTFSALTEAEMLSIRSHYLGQQGRFLSFVIPNDLLSGTSNPSSFTPTGYSWIYADRPRITDIGLQRYDVAVELSTVPPEGATLNGAELTVAATLAAGPVDVSITASGFELSMAASILGGVVADNASAGLDLTVPTSMVSGTATGEAGAVQTSNTFTTLGSTSNGFQRYGYEFTVGASPLTVTALGVVGTTTERVVIHRVSDGVAVATADISSSGTVVTQNITPVALSASTQYTISYQTPSATSRALYRNISGNTFSAHITVNRYVFNSSGTGMPTETYGGTGSTAARFLFTV